MFERDDKNANELKNQSGIIRKKRFSRSRLDRYSGEIILKYREKKPKPTPITEINYWLRKSKRLKVSYSTLYRWLQKHGQVRKSG